MGNFDARFFHNLLAMGTTHTLLDPSFSQSLEGSLAWSLAQTTGCLSKALSRPICRQRSYTLLIESYTFREKSLL